MSRLGCRIGYTTLSSLSQLDGLTGESLLLAAAGAMAYMHHEEDRLAPGGARYVPGGVARLGMVMPPSYAKVRKGRPSGLAQEHLC